MMAGREPSDFDTNALLARLEAAEASLAEMRDYIQSVRGPIHTSACFELLLVGTPWEKPTGYDVEGLYGRMRNALKAAAAEGEAHQEETLSENNDDADLAGQLRYARGLIRKAARSGASFVDVNVSTLAYLVENRRKLNDRLRWAEQRARRESRSPHGENEKISGS